MGAGAVHTNWESAVAPEKAAGKARGETFGYSKRTTNNEVWRFFRRNPKGRDDFFT